MKIGISRLALFSDGWMWRGNELSFRLEGYFVISLVDKSMELYKYTAGDARCMLVDVRIMEGRGAGVCFILWLNHLSHHNPLSD